jgi:hypothetical protein
MYHKVQRVDGKSGAAAFSDRKVAENIRDKFNDRYESEYEVVASEDALASEIGKASAIASIESTN